MPPGEFVRLTFGIRRDMESLIVEYGAWKIRELKIEEREEIEALQAELIEFQDFSTAQELMDEERREIMEKKKRLEELQALKTEGHMEWTIQDRGLIESVLLIFSQPDLPIYVENLPNQLIEKMLNPQLVLNLMPFEGVSLAKSEEPQGIPQSLPGDPLQGQIVMALREINKASNDGREWEELITFHDRCPAEGSEPGHVTESGCLYLLPIKYLHGDWGPINEKLKSVFGEQRFTWHRAGKTSYWKVRR